MKHNALRLSLLIGLLPALAAAAPKPAEAQAPKLRNQAQSLRAAIVDLRDTFGPRYPGAPAYLARLDTLEPTLDQPASANEFDQLRRDALLANPLLIDHPILFVSRQQYTRDHHNTATFFPAAQHEYNTGRYQGGGALKRLDLATGKVTTLLDLKEGVARDPEVSFDGRRIVFSMRKSPSDSYHIYEIGADGAGLRQLTRLTDVDDIDPLYMPDGSIVFSSTREPKYCGCNRHIMANLFRMDADGANIIQMGKSTLFEGHSSLLPDGRILYDRWEYVDRNFGDAQGLWTVNPDGTNHAVYWKNNTPSPGAVLDGRAIPGSELVICTFSSCHDRPWGAIAIIDRRLGMDGKAPVVRIWPADAIDLVKDPGTANNAFDAFTKVKTKYEDPFPLGDQKTGGKYFLCAKMTGQADQTGICLLDVFGNEIMIHVEGPGCFDPMTLGPREMPAALPAKRTITQKTGTFYVQDVYRGTHMAGVQRGVVKSLRVIEVPEKKFWTNPTWNGQGIEGPAMNWHDFNIKQILGTVPVENDGSAYFELPAEKFVYFQLLDKDGQMVQSMRSGTMVQGGESGSCVGCHDDRRNTPVAGYAVPVALRRTPSKLAGWHGSPRPFNYLSDVQPVFDRHCVSCHDFKDQPKSKLILARDRGPAFNAAYTELWSKKQINVVGAGPAQILEAYSWGSHASRIVEVIKKGHYDVKLDAESFDRLVTWIDLNAPYYPSFATAYPNNPFGRSPLDNAQSAKLAQLTGMKFDRTPHWISFDRPEDSLCLVELKKRDQARYQEALTIIRQGAQTLAKTPGPDVDGFVACEIDRWREGKYADRQAIEAQHRQALGAGRKAYDATK